MKKPDDFFRRWTDSLWVGRDVPKTRTFLLVGILLGFCIFAGAFFLISGVGGSTERGVRRDFSQSDPPVASAEQSEKEGSASPVLDEDPESAVVGLVRARSWGYAYPFRANPADWAIGRMADADKKFLGENAAKERSIQGENMHDGLPLARVYPQAVEFPSIGTVGNRHPFLLPFLQPESIGKQILVARVYVRITNGRGSVLDEKGNFVPPSRKDVLEGVYTLLFSSSGWRLLHFEEMVFTREV